MLAAVPVLQRSADDYRTVVGDELIEDIAKLAEPIRGSRILHVSHAPSRPHLSDTIELLTSLLHSFGIMSDWRVIPSKPHEIAAYKTLNQALEGRFVQWTTKMHDIWLRRDAGVIEIYPEDFDFVVVHGAELAGLIEAESLHADSLHAESLHKRASGAKWIWHCHSDITKAQPDLLDILMLCTRKYDRRIICSLEQAAVDHNHGYSTVPPTIDPLSLRNRDLPETFVHMVLRQYGIDPRRPVVLLMLPSNQDLVAISQLLEGLRLARDQVSDLQLLALIMGDRDDQRTLNLCNRLNRWFNSGNGVSLALAANGIGNMEINAFQSGAVAVIGECDHEDSARNLLEVMCKARPVIVGGTSAALLGIEDGQNGCVAHSVEDCSGQIVRLIESTEMAKAIGRGAREYVRDRFLITELLRSYVTMLSELSERKVASVANTARAS